MTGKTLPRLAARLSPEKRKLALISLLLVASIAFSLAAPLITARAINLLFDAVIGRSLPTGLTKDQLIAVLRARGEGNLAAIVSAQNIRPGIGLSLDHLGQVLGLAAVVYLLGAAANWAQAYLMAGVAQRTVYRLRQEADEKLDRLPLRYFDSHSHGEVLSRFTNDIDNLMGLFDTGFSALLSSGLTAITVVGLMFWLSPLLAAVTLVTVPISGLAIAPIARRAQPHFKAVWDQTGELNGLVEETHTAHDLVMLSGQRQPMIDEFDRQNQLLRHAGFRAGFLSGLIQPTTQVIANLNYVFLAALGGWQVATGAISLGSVQALISYSRQFSAPIAQFAGHANDLQSDMATARRVFDFLDAPEEEAARILLAAIEAEPSHASRRVQLEHVSFHYNPDQPLIEDFTLEAAPGQTVAIVGPTGAGKTTIVNLLMRFYEIDGGRILLDGVDYQDLSRDEVRRCYGMVLQDTWLFAGTIRENIAYGREDASDEEIIAAARAADVDRFVSALPDGYATVLDAEASGISVGQKHLLTIARAFLANPGILILDEATSNVDTRTEIIIQNAMARLRAGRTSFVIAHRLSTIQDADTIVVMNAGRIVEQGSHTELLNRGGFYHNLYNSQFADETAS
jgi:ABC-type multidrug transport system fused ATPase/permease subunit